MPHDSPQGQNRFHAAPTGPARLITSQHYERLDPYVAELPLVVCSTGLDRTSGDVHGVMRPRYLEEHAEWERAGGGKPFMLLVMEAAGATAWRGKIALLKGDLVAFGRLMVENHRLVNQMMAYCDLKDEGVQATNALIDAAIKAGALGAKLTGAGGRGSVFAVVPPGDEQHVADAFDAAAHDLGLTQATVLVPPLSTDGLRLSVSTPKVKVRGPMVVPASQPIVQQS